MEFKNMRCLKDYGITRCEGLDFKDDGNKFKGYMYNGPEGQLPITYLHSDGYYYISLRVDYLDDLNYSDYHTQDWYFLAGEFNGVTRVDGDKLLHNCREVLNGVSRLKGNLPVIDDNKIDEMISIGIEEVKHAEDVISEFKEKFDCFDRDLSSYKLNEYIGHVRSLETEISFLKKEFRELHNSSQTNLRYLSDRYNRMNYIFLHKDQYELQALKNYLADKGGKEEC